jgi:hypothetical protein
MVSLIFQRVRSSDHRIDNIYSDFDKQGVNKSISILNGIRTEYLALGAEVSPDQRFF